MHKVAPALEGLLEAVNAVRPHPQNARRGDVAALREALRAHGQYAPLVAQKGTGYLLRGNHLHRAAVEEGWTQVAVTFVDVDDAEARRILVSDNRASDLAVYDEGGLLDLLTGIAAEDSGLAGTLFTDDDFAALLARADAEAEKDAAAAEGSRGLGEPVRSYVLIWDTEEQQQTWTRYLKGLRRAYAGEPTIGARVTAHLRATWPRLADGSEA